MNEWLVGIGNLFLLSKMWLGRRIFGHTFVRQTKEILCGLALVK
jgi:hypothetical protein